MVAIIDNMGNGDIIKGGYSDKNAYANFISVSVP